MFDQIFENFRKASESALQMQQDMYKQWAQQWPAAVSGIADAPVTSGKAAQKRWLELATESLDKQREALDASYKSGIELLEQTFKLSEATSLEDGRRMVEELWRKMFDTMKVQSETQFRDMQKAAELWLEMAQKGSV